MASSSRTNPWSRTRIVFSGMTSGVTAIESSLTGLYVGTSGFSFPTWKGGFYPPDAKQTDFLRLYTERLPSVELNNTFYRLPAETTFRRWAEIAPAGFRFAIKMTMSITHWGRLDDVGTFCERVRLLGDKLGPILVRVHDTRPRDDGFVQLLLGSVDPELQLAFDLRDPSWDGVEPLLAEAGAARVNDLDAEAPFRYVRLREPPYDEASLAAWAGRLATLTSAGTDVYCYFKHEDEPTAPHYAHRLLELAEGNQ
jgi:uncharacterized protein YecE (DUF72 family)